MNFIKSFFISLSFGTPQLFSSQAYIEINIRNNYPFTVWAVAVPGGGQRLEYGGTWTILDIIIISTRNGCIWGRTNCNLDTSDCGHCQTGDCNGLLECQDYGTPPNTLAEHALNLFNSLD
ncbi:Thaumatin-like protein [Capsicum annuum]|uniref:Thaumatin-like protein n=1 Tax=Capsicum annuum TaxID=4072 RepID=A0A2G2Y8Y3_CAPAN|nr:Thaumatin-like protein [Capsicum annuum]PHT66198.1 Thaumatin-like protein [Capsicum annuum]